MDTASSPIGLYIGIYIGAGIFFGLLSAVVAHVQGRHGVGAAFVIGFLLGIIGLVIVAVMPLSEKDRELKAALAAPPATIPAEHNDRFAVGDTALIKEDIIADGMLTFRRGEQASILRVQPHHANPAYKYVVRSQAAGKDYLLNDEALLQVQAAPAGATRPCPYCAEPVRPEAIKCRWCGSMIGELQ